MTSLDPFPPIGLWTDTTQTVGARPLDVRPHLVSKAPTGELVTQLDGHRQLLARVEVLEFRVTRMEAYLRDRTWWGRWQQVRALISRLWTWIRGHH